MHWGHRTPGIATLNPGLTIWNPFGVRKRYALSIDNGVVRDSKTSFY